jgi:endonuclease I
MLRCLFLLLLFTIDSTIAASAPRTFSKAKKAAWKLYAGNPWSSTADAITKGTE